MNMALHFYFLFFFLIEIISYFVILNHENILSLSFARNDSATIMAHIQSFNLSDLHKLIFKDTEEKVIIIIIARFQLICMLHSYQTSIEAFKEASWEAATSVTQFSYYTYRSTWNRWPHP